MSRIDPQQPEFSRPMPADQIGLGEVTRRISANAAERAALMRRFNLTSLDRLDATVRLRRRAGGMIEATGEIEAELSQPCVVTLEPVPASLAETFRVLFAPGARADSGEVIVSVDGEDPPEALTGNEIDIGELAVQQLGVALDPYPRHPNAILPGQEEGEAEPAGGSSPFAVLQALKADR